MTALRLLGLVLVLAGALALAYGQFSYTHDATAVKLGPLELSVKERKTVDIPAWGGIAAIVVGGLLLLFGGRRR